MVDVPIEQIEQGGSVDTGTSAGVRETENGQR
jgi:hypothetical protein